MEELELTLRIDPLTPFHIGTGFGMGKFIDRITLKDHLGAVYIPGSTIKGKTRYFGRNLARKLNLKVCEEGNRCKDTSPCIICRIFGSEYHPGCFYFSDAKPKRELVEEILRSERDEESLPVYNLRAFLGTRTGTKVDRRSMTVEEDHLFTTEFGIRQLPLEARIWGESKEFVYPKNKDIPIELLFLLLSFKLVTHLGGDSSRGQGRVRIETEEVRVNGEVKTDFLVLSNLEEVEYYDLYLGEAQFSSGHFKG